MSWVLTSQSMEGLRKFSLHFSRSPGPDSWSTEKIWLARILREVFAGVCSSQVNGVEFI